MRSQEIDTGPITSGSVGKGVTTDLDEVGQRAPKVFDSSGGLSFAVLFRSY